MRFVCVRGDNAGPLTGSGTNTWLILGAEPALIDAAEDRDEYAQRVAEALEAEQPGASLARVLVTHAHPDHISGVEAIHRRWPGAAFVKMPDPMRDQNYTVDWTAVEDEALVKAGDGVLEAIHTPGHAPDHLCYFEPRTATLFCGDLLVNGGTVTIPASAGGDLKRYIASLKRVLDLQPRRALSGHGEPIENPGALIRAYIGHRQMREQQILDVLSKGSVTVDEIVRRVYQGLQPELHKAAEENVLAHLLKLRGEGQATHDEDESRWRMRDV
jgi:ribonuclease/clavin/mitogillin